MVEVKVVNMEVKPPFVCFTMGWFVDNRLEAHRVDDKKRRREGNVRIRRWQQISKDKRISGFKASQMHELKPNYPLWRGSVSQPTSQKEVGESDYTIPTFKVIPC